MYWWNCCPSGCSRSFREESGLLAQGNLVSIRDGHPRYAWDWTSLRDSVTFSSECPNAWRNTGNVGLPLPHDWLCCPVHLVAFWKSECLLEEWISSSCLGEVKHGFWPSWPKRSISVLSTASDVKRRWPPLLLLLCFSLEEWNIVISSQVDNVCSLVVETRKLVPCAEDLGLRSASFFVH